MKQIIRKWRRCEVIFPTLGMQSHWVRGALWPLPCSWPRPNSPALRFGFSVLASTWSVAGSSGLTSDMIPSWGRGGRMVWSNGRLPRRDKLGMRT